jgi:hypothetical protein
MVNVPWRVILRDRAGCLYCLVDLVGEECKHGVCWLKIPAAFSSVEEIGATPNVWKLTFCPQKSESQVEMIFTSKKEPL